MTNFCSSLSTKTVTISYSDPVDLRYSIWEIWQNEAIPGMGEKRSIAVQLMIECERNNSKELNLSGLGLTSLPSVLPKGLRALDIHNNQLSEITPVLAPTLITLDASENQLTILPNMGFLLELTSLNVSHNRLLVLSGDLPPALEILFVNNNLLEEIPILPLFLIKFVAHNNNLIHFHGELPPTLQLLDVRNNSRLTRLPTEMQRWIVEFFASGSQPKYISCGSPFDLKKFGADVNLLISIFGQSR
ncbi:leucine-rich repeat domain-containing protein [Sodalis sp. dw_96]|uniref:leucine-rich repeat domain-containing protein n=1 Tax=Sodalis sp. dw_96 TaxID=2719794 RepID=UPI001BD3D97B|nr:leucine-rich repeat domain-containing protein [Sodalis sp. dw_96]